MKIPPTWTREQLERDAKIASANFRKERLQEPLSVWKQTFDLYREKFSRLFEQHGANDPRKLTQQQLVEILKARLGETLRYMAGPPISDDDLKVLADTSLSPSAIGSNPQAAKRVLDTIVQSIDPRRFPWIAEDRRPRPSEKAAAFWPLPP